MKIKQFKRKCMILSLVLILTGTFVFVAGFGIIGFNYNDLKENPIKDTWYQTIHINNDNLWYGVKLGDHIHLLTIGNVE